MIAGCTMGLDRNNSSRSTFTPPPHLNVVLQRALGGRRRAIQSFVGRDRLPESARQALEAGLDDVMAVVGIQIFNVQAGAGILGESLEPFLEQLGVHLPQL